MFLVLQLHKEFRSVIDKENYKPFKEEWPMWISKVIDFARLEARSRPLIGKLLQKLDSASELECMGGKYNVYHVV